jgi:uncharacterized protein (TIGR00369 family)
VIDHVPRELPLREQIAMELRSHIAERLEGGQPLDTILRQLGDPLTLAESYLAAIQLQSARVLPRAAAKLIDVVAVVGVVVAVFVLLWTAVPAQARNWLPMLCFFTCIVGFVAYTAIAEFRHGRTLGKRLMGIQVVRESGARISFGQSLLRQLPFFGQFFFIDALFALFTERRQRAFELITKTRAVAILFWLLLLAPAPRAAQSDVVDTECVKSAAHGYKTAAPAGVTLQRRESSVANPTPYPAFRDRVHASFARQGLMKTLGGRLVRVDPGHVEVELPYSDMVTQQHGYFHAAAVAAIADNAGGYAALTLMRPDEEVVAAEFKINLLRPAIGARLLADATVVRAGRSLVVSQVTVSAMSEKAPPVPVAVMLQTNFRIPAADATAWFNGSARRD